MYEKCRHAPAWIEKVSIRFCLARDISIKSHFTHYCYSQMWLVDETLPLFPCVLWKRDHEVYFDFFLQQKILIKINRCCNISVSDIILKFSKEVEKIRSISVFLVKRKCPWYFDVTLKAQINLSSYEDKTLYRKLIRNLKVKSWNMN